MESKAENKPVNPLSAHFRQPAIYIRLPSTGQFWSSGLNMSANGELPVYPMTARDEITLRTPDALLNGQGVIDVIQSCCPNITDAWRMPSTDVDAVLIAIRIASYGNEMSFDTTCPHCQAEDRFGADLGHLLGSIRTPDYSKKLHLGDIVIKLKPQEYQSINSTNQINYEEQRVLNTLANAELDDEVRLAEYKKHMERLVDLNAKILVDSTEYIEIQSSGTVVAESAFIKEFYLNCDADICKAVREQLAVFSKQGALQNSTATCTECTNTYEVPLSFDYASFFADSS